jgi:outer membrane protein assembly factor BamE
MRQIFLLPLVLLTACGAMPKLEVPNFGVEDYLSSYHLDIRQGNFITQEMVSQLKPGQTREQVRFVLGTPLVTDPFHGDRWDYVYRYDNGKGDVQQRRLTVYFADNKLARVAGDAVAADPNAGQALDAVKPREVDVVPATGSEATNPAPAAATPAAPLAQ